MDRGAWQATVHGVPKTQDWVTNTHIRFMYHGLDWQSDSENINLYHAKQNLKRKIQHPSTKVVIRLYVACMHAKSL